MYSVHDISQPEAEPVTLAQAKTHCRVDFDDDDLLIGMWITAARQYVEKVTRRPIFNRIVLLTMDSFPLRWNDSLNPLQNTRIIPNFWDHFDIKLPKPKCQSVTSVTYQLYDGTVETIDPSLYRVDLNSEPARIAPAPGWAWPYIAAYVPGTVQVTYVAGSYGDGVEVNNCPQTLVGAMLLLINHWYVNREAVSALTMKTLPLAVSDLLNTERKHIFGYGM